MTSRYPTAGGPDEFSISVGVPPLPSGTFPGVDDQELYSFLEAHAG